MEIANKEHLKTLYDILSDTWELFQQDFKGDPDLEFSSDYEDLTLLHDHLKSLVNLVRCCLNGLLTCGSFTNKSIVVGFF